LWQGFEEEGLDGGGHVFFGHVFFLHAETNRRQVAWPTADEGEPIWEVVSQSFQLIYPFKTGHLPLVCSGNPVVTDESYRGFYGKHLGQVLDLASGRSYYYNRFTKLSCWEQPEGYVPPPLAPLPPPWVEREDGEGRGYYHNPVTQERVWGRPAFQPEPEPEPLGTPLSEWLASEGLTRFEAVFREQGAESADDVLDSGVSDAELKDLGVQRPARVRLRALIDERHSQSIPPPPEPELEEAEDEDEEGGEEDAGPILRYKCVAQCLLSATVDQTSDQIGQLEAGELVTVLEEGVSAETTRVRVAGGWLNQLALAVSRRSELTVLSSKLTILSSILTFLRSATSTG